MRYVRLYTGSDGETHLEDRQAELAPTEFAPPAPPLDTAAPWPAERVVFVRAEAGWRGDWHPAPRRQLVFYLSGAGEVQVSDGEVRRFGPGAVLLLEDTHGKGHLSRALGEEALMLAMVQLPE
jgi:quercetin dioxygenase-like cupin family protein